MPWKKTIKLFIPLMSFPYNMKVIVYSTKPFEKSFLESSNKNGFDVFFLPEPCNMDTIHKAADADAISIFTNDDASAPVIKKLKEINPGVKGIATRAAGYDNIDLESCKDAGIKVANVPAYSPYAIAEHTVAMILALNRKLVQTDKQVHDFNFSLDKLIGFDLNGKTVGIIGTGRIGRIVVKILHGFGCRILAYDLYPDAELTGNYGVEYVSLQKLCMEADIVSLHTCLTPETKYLINKDNISLMKDGVMIINTCRGPVINTQDLIEGLKTGKVGAAGLDVYEKEKGVFFYDHSHKVLQDDMLARLLSFPNVLITPHQAFLTREALTNIADTTFENLQCWSEGRKSPNELF